MNLQNMTKDQLLNYIVELQQEVDKLNVLENERKKKEEALEENLEQLSRKNRYQEIISVITQSVHQSIDLQTVLDNSIEAIRKNINKLDIVSIYLIEGDDIVVKAHKGFTKDYIKRAGRIPYPKGATWKTVIEEKSRYVPDVDLDDSLGEAVKDMGFKCYLIVPLFIENKVVGTMSIFSYETNVFDEEDLKLLEIVSKQISIAIRNATQAEALKKSEETLKENLGSLSRKSRYEEIISIVTRSVHGSLELDEVLENAVRAMHENIKYADNIGFFCVEGDYAVIKANRGYSKELLNKVKKIPRPKGFTWKTILEGKLIYCSDAETDSTIGPAGKKAGTKSYASMPIKLKDKTIACININSFQKDAFDKEDLNLLNIVAQQIEVAINNATQAEALKKSEETLKKNLDSLSRKNRYEEIISTVTRSVHRSLEFGEVIENALDAMNKHIQTAENVSIYMVEGEDAVLKSYRGYPERFVEELGRIPRPKGFTWRTILSGKPLHCPDVDNDPYIGLKGRQMGTKSYVCMPICYSGKAIGCINVNSNKKYAFDNGELKLLEIVANQIETALNNAKQAEVLKDSEELLKRNIEILSKKSRYRDIISTITRSVHRSIDLNEVLENAVNALNKNVDYADHVAIYLIEGDTAVLKSYVGYPKWFAKKVANIPKPKGATWETLIEGKPRYCGDVDKDTSIGQAAIKVGTKSYASMPIKYNHNTIGCINISSRNLNAFNEEEIKLLDVVATQIESAINNANQAEALKISREELRKSEKHFRLLVETTNIIPWEADAKTFQFKYIGPQAEKLLGYPVEKWYEQDFWPTHIYPDDREKTIKKCLKAIAKKKDSELEYRMISSDGNIIWFHDLVSVITEDKEPITLRGFMINVTERKKAEIQLIQSREQLRKLATRMQSIREEEITSLARWIHDDLGQLLTGLKIEISLMDKRLSSASNGGYSYPAKRMKSISGLIDTAIFRVQRISTELRSPVLDTLGLVEAIKYQSKEFESMSGINCEVDIKMESIDPDQKRSIAIFRVLQESLTNIARHANATRVGISMKLSGENLLLEVEDNGRGITNSEIVNPKSVGILGMEERVLVFGGDLKIRGIPKKGTIVSVILPLNNVNM